MVTSQNLERDLFARASASVSESFDDNEQSSSSKPNHFTCSRIWMGQPERPAHEAREALLCAQGFPRVMPHA